MSSQAAVSVLRQDARDLAVQVLLRLERAQSPVQSALNSVLSHKACAPTDAALCAELCYGALRMEIRLTWMLAQFLRAPKKLPPHMRCVLLVAAYALLFMENMPQYAVVDWAVKRIKRAHGQTLAKVANACLRGVCREGDALRQPAWYHAAGPDAQTRQAVFYSLPLWIVRLWDRAYGPDKTTLLIAKSSVRPALGLRVNRSQPGWKNLAARLEEAGAHPLTPACFRVDPELRASLERDCGLALLHTEGKLSRQGVASQLALSALHPQDWPEPLWDACSGQGTKSCALLELGMDLRLASDTHWPRLIRIAGECRRLALACPMLAQASALHPPLGFTPGTIVLDVPCSGLGVLASRPDIRRWRGPGDVAELTRLQFALLNAAYAVLSPGGQIAYLTCTQNPGENEELIHAFLKEHPGSAIIQEWNSPLEDTALEGMYAALLVKR